MQRRILAVAVSLAWLILLPSSTSAQTRVSALIGGGASVPLGAYADIAQTGWQTLLGVTLLPPWSPVEFRVDLTYGANAHDGPSDDKTQLPGVMGGLLLPLGAAQLPVRLYATGGVGAVNHRFVPGAANQNPESAWKFAWALGAGLSGSLGPIVGLFVESRVVKRGDTTFLPIMAGLRFGGAN